MVLIKRATRADGEREREKQLNELKWEYRQRDREYEINNIMDMIRACAAEMQRVLMGSLDSRLHPTKCVGFSHFLYRPTVEAPIWKCFESSSGEYTEFFFLSFWKCG